jgi:hypothetical protein
MVTLPVTERPCVNARIVSRHVRAVSLSILCVATAAPCPAQEIDVTDVIRMVLKRPPAPPPAPGDAPRVVFTITPTIGSKPSTGLTFGALASFDFYRGDPSTTGISTTVVGLSYSLKDQVNAIARLSVFANGNRFLFHGDNRLQWTSQDTLGLGMDTSSSDRVNLRFDRFRISETAHVAVRPSLYVGAGAHVSLHRNVRRNDASSADTPYDVYTRDQGFDPDGQSSIAPVVGLLRDTRDNIINASRGSLMSLAVRPYVQWLGSDSTWQELLLEFRGYRAVSGDGGRRLALWAMADGVLTGKAPYYDLPATAGDPAGRSGRGYAEGHFRGDRLLYAEVEYRATLTGNGLIGMVGFLNATTVSDRTSGQHLFDRVAPGGGAGLRVLFSKESRTNLCIDIGFGERGSRGLYFGLQEAF